MLISRRRLLATAAALPLAPPVASAQEVRASADIDHKALARRAVDGQIYPKSALMAAATTRLHTEIAAGNDPKPAFNAAFDAWVAMDFLRFGATEEANRNFALLFWPDKKGRTPRLLSRLIAAEDPVITDPAAFARQSIAARGLMAMEHLLYGADAQPLSGYRRQLAVAIAGDMALTAKTLAARWRDPYGPLLITAGAPKNPLYFKPQESTLELFKALMGGVEYLKDMRLGRPLGGYDRPRPKRAEAWRSNRSLRNISLSITALHEFYRAVFAPILSLEQQARIDAAFRSAAKEAADAPSPLHEAVSQPGARLQIEAIQTRIARLREETGAIGEAIGAGVTFNSLDGD
ncbi:MAG: imelysin family protein [Neomegalonema sp.]|nr:imelysin family protein [Neomegalonema sp.]